MLEQKLPGKLFKEQYIDGRISVIDAARLLNVSKQSLFNIFNGTSMLSPQMAIKIGIVTGTDPKYWWDMQCNYNLEMALQMEYQVIPNALCDHRSR